MKINVVFNKEIPAYSNVLKNLEEILIKKHVEFHSFDIDNMQEYGDFTFVIGGDGTLLKSARFYAGTPVLGINLGRLGFLAQAGADEIERAVDNVLNDKYSTEERIMLESGVSIALNDFVIKGCMLSRTSKFYLEINDKFVCDYIADGLIISTPTGSTAYGLSAGGPVVDPKIESILLTPICTHSLFARSLIFESNAEICVKIPEKEKDVYISCDGDPSFSLEPGSILTVRKAKRYADFIRIKQDSFIDVLNSKLSQRRA